MRVIYPNKQLLLLPVSKPFLWLSLVIACVIDLVPMGALVWLPSMSLLVLMFWALHQSSSVGIFTALIIGLLVDIHWGSALGANALIYCSAAFMIDFLGYRLRQYDARQQAIQLLPLFLVLHCAQVTLALLLGGSWAGWSFLIAPVLDALLWCCLDFVLLLPQRQPLTKDKNRPI